MCRLIALFTVFLVVCICTIFFLPQLLISNSFFVEPLDSTSPGQHAYVDDWLIEAYMQVILTINITWCLLNP